MRSTLNKVSLFILQNIPTLVFFFIPLFFLTNTIDFFAFNKFYLLNVLATISLIFWCLQNLLTNRINLTTSPTLTALGLLLLAHLASAFFISSTTVLSLTGLTTLFVSLFIIHLTYTSTHPSNKFLKQQIFALLFPLFLVSLITILHFFNLLTPFLGTELIKSKYFNLTGGIVPALTFSIPLLIGTLGFLFYEENFKTKIILFLVSGIVTTATLINISLLLPKDGISPVVSLPFKASWSIALDIFKFPGTALIGTGPETYLSTFTRLRPAFLNANSNLWNTRFSESGSLFLTLLTTTGLLGGLSFLFLFFKNINLGLRKLSLTENKPLLAFTTASLTIFLLVFLFTTAGIVSIITATILLGFLTQLLKNQEIKSIKTLSLNINSDDNQNKVLDNFLPLFTLIFSLTLLLSYWSFGGRFYYASILLNQAKAQINSNLTGAFLKQQQAQKLNQYDPTYPIIISQTYQQVALFYLQKTDPTEADKKNAIETMQRAIDSGRQAARLDPYNVLVWENLSNIYQTFIGSADGSIDLAISHLAQAISLDPTNPRLRIQMGILYYNLKDIDQSFKLINQAMELKPNWEVPYLNLYRIYLEAKDFSKAQAYLKQGLALTNPTSPNYEKLQTELTSLTEKLPPLTASPSAQPKK